MSNIVKRVAGAKSYCAKFHWQLWRVTEDGDKEPLFRITVPGPMGIWIVMNADSANPRGLNIDELERLLYVVKKAIDANFYSDDEVWVYSGQDPDAAAIETQYVIDVLAGSVDALVPSFD